MLGTNLHTPVSFFKNTHEICVFSLRGGKVQHTDITHVGKKTEGSVPSLRPQSKFRLLLAIFCPGVRTFP